MLFCRGTDSCSICVDKHPFNARCFVENWSRILHLNMKPEKYVKAIISFSGMEVHFETNLSMDEQAIGTAALHYAFSKMFELKNTQCYWQCLFNYIVVASQITRRCIRRLIMCALLCLESYSYYFDGDEKQMPIPLMCLDFEAQSLTGHILFRTKPSIKDLFDTIVPKVYVNEDARWISLFQEYITAFEMNKLTIKEEGEEKEDCACLSSSLHLPEFVV